MAKILIIDDDAAVRETIRRLLQRRGYQVVLAGDGAAGLQLLGSEAPDLVIIDIIMPVKDGFEAVATIRRERPDLKLIAISGGGRVGGHDVLEAARRLGAAGIVQKPFEADELLGCIKSCLDDDRTEARRG